MAHIAMYAAGRAAAWVAPEVVAHFATAQQVAKLTHVNRQLRRLGTHPRSHLNLFKRSRFRQMPPRRYKHRPGSRSARARQFYGEFGSSIAAYRRRGGRSGRRIPYASKYARDPARPARPKGKARAKHWRTAGRVYRRAVSRTAQVFPDRQRAVVEWKDIVAVKKTSGDCSAWDTTYTLNNPNDPVAQGFTTRSGGTQSGTHWSGTANATMQPVGHSGLGIMYKNFRVDKCEVIITAAWHPSDAAQLLGGPVFVGFQTYPETTGDVWQIPKMEAHRAWHIMPHVDGPYQVPPMIQGNKFSYKRTFDMNKIVGVSFQDFHEDAGYVGTHGLIASPAKLIMLRMLVRAHDHLKLEAELDYTVRLRYHVTYFNLKDTLRPAGTGDAALQEETMIIPPPTVPA